jgi:hypothetical protein
MAYRVRNWEKHFENNRSKTVSKLSWVPIPNSHDGEGFATVISHKDAAEIFSAWILILQVASRCHPRGSLVREGGKPYDAASLALRTRGQLKWFEKAMPILLEVGWIEEFASEWHSDGSALTSGCQSTDEGRKEENGMNGSEQNGTRSGKISQEEWFLNLKSESAYSHIDIDREMGKMRQWLLLPKNKGRTMTKQFVVNWLNKIEPGLNLPSRVVSPTVTDEPL